MVFVHARNATVRTANVLLEMARQKGDIGSFTPESSASFTGAALAFSKAKSKQLLELFNAGFSVHHAGLFRPDR